MLLKNHLDIISMHEPVQRKARFWTSYMRALKGTDDMRAPTQTFHARPRPYLFDVLPPSKLDTDIYRKPYLEESTSPFSDEARSRIKAPGYRYDPVSRETYGYSPRNIYAAPERLYRPGYSEYPLLPRSKKYLDDPLDRLAPLDLAGPLPLRPPYALPFDSPAAYHYPGQPTLRGTRSASPTPVFSRRPLRDYLDAMNSPAAASVRDPWWWHFPELRPYESPYQPFWRSPAAYRGSYLSPIKINYLWRQHPLRENVHVHRW